MRTLFLALALAAAVGCDDSTPTGPGVAFNQRFTLARGETARVADTGVFIEFIGVTGDSRCPADAVCIQGGDALVTLHVYDPAGDVRFDLHTGDSSKASATYRDMTIALVELQPYPFSSRPIAANDYRATLTVSR